MSAKSFQYGYTFLVYKISEEIGLTDDLLFAFGGETYDLLAIAAYRILYGTSIWERAEWQEDTYFPYPVRPAAPSLERKLYQALTREKQDRFFPNWVQRNQAQECSCHEDALLLSYPESDKDLSAYDPKGEKLPPIRTAVFVTPKTQVPVCFLSYRGFLYEERNFFFVLDRAKEMGIENVRMFACRDFWSEKGFQLLGGCRSFTLAVPPETDFARDAIKEVGRNIEDFKYALPRLRVNVVELNRRMYGFDGKLLLFFDVNQYAEQCIFLDEWLMQREEELKKISSYAEAKRQMYADCFHLEPVEGSDGFTFHCDADKMNRIRQGFGYTLFFSTDRDLTPSQLWTWLKAQEPEEELSFSADDGDEELPFGDTKEERDGEVFVQFVTVILKKYLLLKTKEYRKRYGYSLREVLKKLCRIRAVPGGPNPHLLKKLTEDQQEVLSLFDAGQELLSSVEKTASTSRDL